MEKEKKEAQGTEAQESLSFQSQLEAQLREGNTRGTKIVEESEAPILGSHWFKENQDTDYKTVEVLLQKPDLTYEKMQVYVRRGVVLADNLAITQTLDERLPKPEDVREFAERAGDVYTPQERKWLSARDSLRQRKVLTMFLYQVPAKNHRRGKPPVPLFAWEPGDPGYDVHSVSIVTVQELYRAYLRVNPDSIPLEEVERFQGVQSDGAGSGMVAGDVSGGAGEEL